MTTKLIQKDILRGRREFEIIGDDLKFRVKTPFKDETLDVVLSILNPEPVVDKPYLHFYSRVKCGPLVSLFLNKPNQDEFNAFVEELSRRALEDYEKFAGIRRPSGSEQENSGNAGLTVNPEKIDVALQMLRQYLNPDDIQPLLEVLEAIRNDPENSQTHNRLVDEFHRLGPMQGAVLTYAPYLKELMSGD